MIGVTTLSRALRRVRASRIGLRLLAFNVLLVFVPVAGVLYLDVYEAELLEAQERGMVQQARLLAAALADGPRVEALAVNDLLARLPGRGETRFRVYTSDGVLVADSARGPHVAEAPTVQPYSADGSVKAASGRRDQFLYRFGAWVVRVRRAAASAIRRALTPAPDDASMQPEPSDQSPEVRAALQGRYGAATRQTPGQRSLTLHSAVPIRSGGRVIGAAVVSQSTFRILQALYDIRLRIFQIVVASIVVAALLSIAASATIVRPLVGLRRAAIALSSRRGGLRGTFHRVNRRDEIGDLARALEELASRLDAHIRLLESFAADVAHEFKNPLASIRTAAETLSDTTDSAERQRFLRMLTRDVDRLERLVSGVRELARIDAQLAQEPLNAVDVGGLLTEIIDGMRSTGGGPIALTTGPSTARVRASLDRLAQVFENILHNARSFAGPNAEVEVAVRVDGGECFVTIADRGPGIPPAHLERVFERFFTYRPAEQASHGEHAGLGLAIARAIVESYGGTIVARNRADGGASFELRFPSA